MIIKSNNNNTWLLQPEDIKEFLGMETEKYVVINKETNEYSIENLNEFVVTEAWVDEVIDGRKLRKIKKDILKEFGNELLKEYSTTDKIYKSLCESGFINMAGPSEVIKNALANNMNLILYGPGGFGKSEVCDALFGGTLLKDRVFVQSLSEATTEEDLFGGIKMKKFLDSGEKEYLVENSFANKEIVIFEEIFDAPARVLAALKDTLTSKEVRNGNQRFPIKTKIIIGLTNKTFDEIIEDDSTEALTQRFPISYKFQYAINRLNTASLILNRHSDFDKLKLAAIVETIQNMKDLSPRKILEMAKYVKNLDVKNNRNYSEKITNNLMTPVIDYIKMKKTVDMDKILFNEVVALKKDIKDENIRDYDSFVDAYNNLGVLLANCAGEAPMTLQLQSEINILLELLENKLK